MRRSVLGAVTALSSAVLSACVYSEQSLVPDDEVEFHFKEGRYRAMVRGPLTKCETAAQMQPVPSKVSGEVFCAVGDLDLVKSASGYDLYEAKGSGTGVGKNIGKLKEWGASVEPVYEVDAAADGKHYLHYYFSGGKTSFSSAGTEYAAFGFTILDCPSLLDAVLLSKEAGAPPGPEAFDPSCRLRSTDELDWAVDIMGIVADWQSKNGHTRHNLGRGDYMLMLVPHVQ